MLFGLFLLGGLGESATKVSSLELTTGLLTFDASVIEKIIGPYVATFTHSSLVTAQSELTRALSTCGTVENYLPHNSFLFHVASNASACLEAATSLPGFLGVAPLRAELRVDPQLTPNPDPTGLRVVSLTLARGTSFDSLSEDLLPVLTARCPTCEILNVRPGVEAHITSLGPACNSSCGPLEINSPFSCGCHIPPTLFVVGGLGREEALAPISAHPHVLWAWRVEGSVAFNAFGRGMMETTDLPSWAEIAAEYGACSDDTCNHRGNLPFSQVPARYGAFLPPFPAAAQEHGQDDGVESKNNKSGLTNQGPPRTAYSPLRGLQTGTCNAACSGSSCSFGFGKCGGLESPITALGLTGVGQIVQVVDTGLDTGLPFFYDPTHPYVVNSTDANVPADPPPPGAHRKVKYYWAYADAYDNDNGRGHGSHVAGSVGGDAAGLGPSLLPSDAAILTAVKGSAPGARFIIADVGCSTPGGCARDGVVPPRTGFCALNSYCVPTDISQLFTAARAGGAYVSCNSWGGGANSVYTANSAALDDFIFNAAEDMLLVFAAANSGFWGFYTISELAVAKNVLAVGATIDGAYGHLAKTKGLSAARDGTPIDLPPLYQALDGRACGAVILSALAQNATGMLPTGCPLSPTPQQCYALALEGQNNLNPTPGGFPASNIYGGTRQAELALCCGCTLENVVEGCLVRSPPVTGAPTGPCATPATLSTLLQNLLWVYNARWPAAFSSLGPANDERIKPDVTSVGFEIMSARSAGGFRYNSFQCPQTYNLVNDGGGSVNFVGSSFTVPLSQLFATITIAPTTEPFRLNSITIPILASTSGYFEVYVVSTSENNIALANLQMSPVRVPVPVPFSTEQNIVFDFTANGWGGWEMGNRWAGSIQIFAAAGQVISYYAPVAGSPNTVPAACTAAATGGPSYSPAIGTEVKLTLSIARGGALGYISSMSGTSMSTPAVAGAAALVRQYYTEGWHVAGTPTPGNAFRPSAALLKATLINGATPLLDSAYNRVFNLPDLPRWQETSQGGYGVPNLVRGLSFASLGSKTRSAGELPTLLLPGLLLPTTPGDAPVEPALSQGQSHVYCISTAPTASALNEGIVIPLLLTLVWTDPPSTPGAALNLVNDLDLIVRPPSGNPIAYGNAPNATAPGQTPDTINNVEHLSFFAPGISGSNPFRVEIRGTTVPVNAPQKYALVVTGPGVSLTVGTPGCP